MMLWRALASIGGGLSLVFIVVLVVLMALLALVYLAAALIVLSRFARAQARLLPAVLAGLLLGLLVSAAFLRLEVPEVSGAPWGEWLRQFAAQSARILPLCAVAMATGRLLLRRVPLGWLGAALLLLALAGVSSAVVPGLEAWQPIGLLALEGIAGAIVLGLVPLAAAGLLEIRRGPEWFIAARYLVAERRQIFISVITLICIGAVAAGVWLIITVLSVMNGFERTWRDEIVGNYAHFLVRSYYGDIVGYDDVAAQVAGMEGVLAVSPYIEAEGMVRVGTGSIAPLRLRGIDPESAVKVTTLAEKLVEGDLSELALREGAVGDAQRAPPAAVIGRVLAEKLGAGVGDEVVLISPYGGPQTPLGPAPRLMRFRIVGLFVSSFLQYDELYAYASLPAVQSFLAVDDVAAGLEVKTVDFYRSRQLAMRVADELGHPFFTRDWKDLFPQFFRALKDNRSLMFMLLIMIMVISAFVIIVTLMMMIMAKSSDIGILKTMGATNQSIELIFAIEGTIIGIAGVGVGVLAGIAVSRQLAWVQSRIEEVTGIDTLPSSVYQISTLPSEVDPIQVAFVASIALVLALGATLLPSRHGARLDPVEALRHD